MAIAPAAAMNVQGDLRKGQENGALNVYPLEFSKLFFNRTSANFYFSLTFN